MKLAEFSVKNSLLVNMVSVFLIATGILVMLRMPLDMFPAVDFDIVTITTSYAGAPAEDVEKYVTIPIEKELKGISGIKEMESSSDEGLSIIGITIDPEASDKNQVVEDIQKAVDRVRNLPDGVEDDPVVFELKSKERPVLEISISGNYPEIEKRRYAEALEDILLEINGVSSVRRIGWRDQEYWVELDPVKLKELYVSMDEVIDALRERNITLPGGQIKTAHLEYSVRITGEFNTVEQIENVIIRANDEGNWLKIKDVGRVIDTFEDETRIAKINKKRAVAMVVIKSEYGDVVRVADKIKETVESFESQLPEGMEAVITNDLSYYVKRRLGVLKNNGMIGFILVLIILFLFLEFVPALMTAVGIPIAILITFIIMQMFSININLVSMLGLIIVFGMLVDDGIIVAENVFRYVEMGMDPREAAKRGTQEVIAPVTVTILTTCAAFAPLLFMKDIMGKFIREVPMVVMFALFASLLEAFIILPSHLADFVSMHRNKFKAKKYQYRPKQWFQKLVHFYTKFLKWALNYRRLFVFGILIPLLISSILLWKYKVKFTLFPDEGIEQFNIRAEAQKGITLDKLNELIGPVEDLVAELPNEYMDSFRTYLGSIEEERGFDPNAKRGTHLGQITVFLTPFQSRDKSAKEVANMLRDKLKTIEGFEKLYIARRKAGPPVGKAVSVAIKGEQFSVIQELSVMINNYLEGKIQPDDFVDVFGSDSNNVKKRAENIFSDLKAAGYINENDLISEDFNQVINQNLLQRIIGFLNGTFGNHGHFTETIKDYSKSQRRDIKAILTEYRNHAKGISDINIGYEFGKKQLKVLVNEEKAKMFYLTVGKIAQSVRTAFKGSVATSVKPLKAAEEIDVVVRFQESLRNDIESFDDILIENQFNKLVPLQSVAQIVEEDGVYTINHKDGKRVIYVTGNVDSDVITSLEVNQNLQKKFKDLGQKYLGYTIQYGGEFEEQMESRKNLMISFAVALSIIFIILTAMFRSLIQPFIVMLAIPFGLIGVIFAFYLHGKTLNFFALMGIVGLTGIVVNDSIVLVDFINRLRMEGKGRRQSLIEAGQIRLRPVIMTSVTTIGGLVAVAYGIGGGDPFLKPMALAIIWGLAFATILTLILIPCIYALFDDFVENVLHLHMVKGKESPAD